MASLQEFISQVAGEGLMRSSRFAVTFSLPSGIVEGTYSRDIRKVLLYCDNINLPGLTLETTSAKTFGEHREMPYNKLFDTVNMGFYVDNAMSVKLLFDSWMGAIQDPTTRTFNYYWNYVTDIVVDVFDIADNSRYQVTLYQCYPKAINPVQMDYGSKDVMKMTVAMNYKYWKSTSAANIATSDMLGDTIAIPNSYLTDFQNYQNEYNVG